VTERQRLKQAEQAVLSHINAAYNLARWLIRNDTDAADVLQEAYLRALRSSDGLVGESPKVWLLSILRHTCFTWLARNRPGDMAPLDDAQSDRVAAGDDGDSESPGRQLLVAGDRILLDWLIARLPAEFREVIILRELEELSYREISEVTAVPVGAITSRLARARGRLREDWQRQHGIGDSHGL
jgi:RNA polymerase sigma-70 factor (ECF subfamily)